MRRFLMLTALAVLLCLGLTACGGDVSRVERVIGPSELFTETEIKGAMSEVAMYFKTEFDGCTLTELRYDEEKTAEAARGWAEQYGAEEAIVLLSTFEVDASGGDGSLNPNSTYKNWQWVLTRTTFGWDLRTWGYG